MTPLLGELIRPYRAWLAIILLAAFLATAMSLAGPWPLKIVLDNAAGHHGYSMTLPAGTHFGEFNAIDRNPFA
jgi:ABC-type multidrug transport system fused ATPase/permease subunit